MSHVVLDGIRKSYKDVPVLHDISIKIETGSFVSLLGASGCGKTTLLRIVAGLESVSDGRVVIDGVEVTSLPPERRNISMMFQSYALLPHLSVYENVRFPLRMRRIGARDEQDAKVRSVLDLVQLGHLSDRKPRQLSGGQQQRVAFARAVVSDPKVLLLDEPLSNLDARLREDMQVELLELHRRLGLTTIFVTHDQEEALSLSDKVVLLNQGRIEQEGKPVEIYSAPASEHASMFLGAANLLNVDIVLESGKLELKLDDGQRLSCAEGGADPGSAKLVIRQEDIRLSRVPVADALKAIVVARVFLGARYQYVLRVAGGAVRAVTDTNTVFDRDDEVWISAASEKRRLLPR
jgi:putative spermidine/putrescine transport system ATP-binding protein